MDDHTPPDDTGRGTDANFDPDFEAQLTAGLHAMVDAAQPSPELRQRISDRLAAPARSTRRRWLPAAAAALLLVVGIGVVAGLDSDDGGSVDVATDPAPLDDDADADDDPSRPDIVQRTTTSTTAPSTTTTEPEAEVLGESTTRTPGQDDRAPATPAPPAPSTTPPPTAAPASPAPAPTAPPTTALVCRNSTDPACGSFRWDPAPQNRPATLTFEVPDRIVAGVPFEVRATVTDPDGPVDFSCATIANDGGEPQIGGGCVTEPQECPARYGPWSPPAPKGSSATTTRTMQIDQPGTYTVHGTVSAAAGCDNVDPYRSGASAEISVEVVADQR